LPDIEGSSDEVKKTVQSAEKTVLWDLRGHSPAEFLDHRTTLEGSNLLLAQRKESFSMTRSATIQQLNAYPPHSSDLLCVQISEEAL
jgi:hypothetical protein